MNILKLHIEQAPADLFGQWSGVVDAEHGADGTASWRFTGSIEGGFMVLRLGDSPQPARAGGWMALDKGSRAIAARICRAWLRRLEAGRPARAVH